jgi:hypothetical protein
LEEAKKVNKRFVSTLVLAALVLALPMTAFAAKTAYQARLSTGAELHEVVGSNARGTLNLGTVPDSGLQFSLSVRNLSGNASAAHLHGPADADQNGPVVVTLCGDGPNSVAGPCVTDGSGWLLAEGVIMGYHLQGISGGNFMNALNNGLIYVNVHTELNPAGEARGQVYRR